MEEKEFLDSKFETYDKGSDCDHFIKDSYLMIYEKYLSKNDNSMEMGCLDGYTSIKLSKMVNHLDVIDGSRKMLDELEKRVEKDGVENISTIYSLFEDYKVNCKYDSICCSYVLEHVKDPIEVLKMCYKGLKNDGLLLVTVPNALSLSRQMAQMMGLMNDVYDLTENDNNHGHRRVYDLSGIEEDVRTAGFEIIDKGGTFLKQFADFQINKMIECGIIQQQQMDGMRKIAQRYPEISGAIYIIAKKR